MMLHGREQSTFLGRAAGVSHLADSLKSTLVDAVENRFGFHS